MEGNSKNRQGGFTLIELIIAMAILAVIGVAISRIVVFTAKQYKRISLETMLNQQAQNTMNQLKQMIMDAPDGILYSNADEKEDGDCVLQILNGNTILKSVYFSRQENKLYYFEKENTESAQVLAECVASFEVDTTDFEKNRTATIDLVFETEGKQLQTSVQVTSRNEVTGKKD